MSPETRRQPQPTEKQLDAIRSFVARPQGSVAIGRLPALVQAAPGGAADEVLLSADTMGKQVRMHPEVTAEDYLLVPLLVGAPDVAIVQTGRRVLLLRAGARLTRGAVKATRDGCCASTPHSLAPSAIW